MLITESITYVDSVIGTDFFADIMPAASAFVDMQLAAGTVSPIGTHKCIINSVRLISMVDRDWRVEFHSKSYGTLANTATKFTQSNFGGLVAWSNHLATTTNLPANWTGAGTATATAFGTLFVSYVSGLNIPYEDKEGKGQLHANLVNMSGSGTALTKGNGDSGLIHLRVGVIYCS